MDIEGGGGNGKDVFNLPRDKTGDRVPADEAEKWRYTALQKLILPGLRKVVHADVYEAET